MANVMVCTWWSEDNFQKLVLSFYSVGLRDWKPSSGLGKTMTWGAILPSQEIKYIMNKWLMRQCLWELNSWLKRWGSKCWASRTVMEAGQKLDTAWLVVLADTRPRVRSQHHVSSTAVHTHFRGDGGSSKLPSAMRSVWTRAALLPKQKTDGNYKEENQTWNIRWFKISLVRIQGQRNVRKEVILK